MAAKSITCEGCNNITALKCDMAFTAASNLQGAWVGLNQTMNELAGMIGEGVQRTMEGCSLDRQAIVTKRTQGNLARNLGAIGCNLAPDQVLDKLQQYVEETGFVQS